MGRPRKTPVELNDGQESVVGSAEQAKEKPAGIKFVRIFPGPLSEKIQREAKIGVCAMTGGYLDQPKMHYFNISLEKLKSKMSLTEEECIYVEEVEAVDKTTFPADDLRARIVGFDKFREKLAAQEFSASELEAMERFQLVRNQQAVENNSRVIARGGLTPDK